MWPRLITQLLELLPHVTRLVPVADMYFASKSASERTQEATLAALADEVRTGLTHANDALLPQLEAQSAQLALMRTQLDEASAQLSAQHIELAAATHRIRSLSLWLKTGTVVTLLLLAAILFLLLAHSR